MSIPEAAQGWTSIGCFVDDYQERVSIDTPGPTLDGIATPIEGSATTGSNVSPMHEDLSDPQRLLPGTRLEHLSTLVGSDRSQVTRVSATSPASRRTLIVKAFLAADEGWVRESAALSVLPAHAPAPQLVADGATPPIVVMSDLGSGPSVADALLGDDPGVAVTAVLLWVEAVASMHRATAGVRAAFTKQLSARSPAKPVADSKMPTLLGEAADYLGRSCAELDVDLPAGALAELRGLSRLDDAGPAALTPADTCPDNNLRVGDQLKLIDFESAQWRHVAWDLAYLKVPWPSCWCSWRLPADVAALALDRYRTRLVDDLPYVRTPDFERDVALASLGWTFISTYRFLPRALADDPPLGDASHPAPTRRAMILHRLGGALDDPERPALAALAGGLRTELVRRWGEEPLAYARAFL
jgi:hypothetical protein